MRLIGFYGCKICFWFRLLGRGPGLAFENDKKVLCFKNDAFWLDMGNREDYEKATEKFESNPDDFLNRN